MHEVNKHQLSYDTYYDHMTYYKTKSFELNNLNLSGKENNRSL